MLHQKFCKDFKVSLYTNWYGGAENFENFVSVINPINLIALLTNKFLLAARLISAICL